MMPSSAVAFKANADLLNPLHMPWLQDVARRLPDELPGALLLRGQAGIGKTLFLMSLAKAALCGQGTGLLQGCGQCADCTLFAAGTHPDFRLIEPDTGETIDETGEEGARAKRKRAQIPVSAVRGLFDIVAMTPSRGRAKVIVITPAESMHPSAANALLKILEEPTAKTYFLLASSHPHRVLATIKSRCFQLPVPGPQLNSALVWLKRVRDEDRAASALAMAGYAPLAALQLLDDEEFWAARASLVDKLGRTQDVVALAESADILDPPRIAQMLLMWGYDMLALKSGCNVRFFTDHSQALQNAVRSTPATEISRWLDRALEFARSSGHPLNRRLSLESLFANVPSA